MIYELSTHVVEFTTVPLSPGSRECVLKVQFLSGKPLTDEELDMFMGTLVEVCQDMNRPNRDR